MPRQLVVILGMHRSGTSLVTKSIELLGYSLGDNLMPAGVDNPTGFWEDLDIVEFNDRLLAAHESSWDSPLDTVSQEFSPAFQQEALALLESKFTNTDKFIIKDPRMSLLLDFWSRCFAEADISVHYLAVYRQPLDIAASLQARNGMETLHGLLLTYVYNRALMTFLDGRLLIVGYRQFLENPLHELSRIADNIGESFSEGSAESFIEDFIDTGLSHHGSSDDELTAYRPEFPELVDLAAMMSRMSEGSNEQFADHLDQYPDPRSSLVQRLYEYQLKSDFRTKTALRSRLEEQERENKSLHNAHVQTITDVETSSKAELEEVNSRLVEREKHVELLTADVSKLVADVATANELLNDRDLLLKQRSEELSVALTDKQAADERVQALLEQEEDLNRQIVLYQQHLRDYNRIHQDVLGSVSFRLGRALTYPVRKPVTAWLLPRLQGNSGGLAVVKFLRTCIARPVAALKMVSPRRVRNFFLLLTDRKNLAEQVVGNYQLELEKEEPLTDVEVHHHSEQDLSDFSLAFPRFDQPLVSVLIPVYNQIDYTLKCLTSIKQHLPDVTFEIVVADDCSTDATADVLARVEGIKVVAHKENLGFLRSCNRAVDACRGEFIFLLNNDTTVHPGWLDKLVETFNTHPDAGLVGSKLVYPDGTLQEAGGIVWKDASGWNYGRNGDPDAPEFNYLKEVDYVSGAAIMFPRQLFLALGKFDEHLAPAYYEDTDFAFSVRANGNKVYFQPASVITHYEGKSHGTDENAGIKQNQVVNQGKFREKWAEVLDQQHFDNAEEVLRARERSQGKTTVLVIDHYVPHFDKDAGSRSTYQYLQLLVQAGFNVKFLGDNFFKHEPYTSVLQDMGIEVLYGPHYEKNWERWLRDHLGYVDVVYMMRPHIAERYIDVVNSLEPRPRTIYFGHDLHYLRLQRQLELHPDEKLAAEKAYWEQKEYELFEKFDQVYYPSQVEVDEIHARNPDLPVKAIPLYAFDEFADSPPEFASREGLIFVGGFNHPPNSDGLVWFVNEVFPVVLESLPDVQLHIVGSNMPEEIRQLESHNIKVEGFLSDEALGDLYQRIRMSVVPLRFGAGIKGKVLEAMQKGIPVATTSIGAEGIVNAETGLLIGDSVEELAGCIVATYGDLEKLEQHSVAGLDTIANHFSTEAVLKVIAEDFRTSKTEQH